jgi:hypothetical protein
VPEVRRVILALAAPEEEREFRLGWSLWRRAHQAIARRCHTASRAVQAASDKGKTSPLSTSVTMPTLDRRRSVKLTDEEWMRLQPLLPDNGYRGRQWREHRTILDAILWVLVNSASWRGLPEEFGPWQTAYYRYARWRQEGLWQRVVEMLLQC